jgi:hypothetical protein
MLEYLLNRGWGNTQLALAVAGFALVLFLASRIFYPRKKLDLPVAKLIPGSIAESLMQARALV